MKRIQFTLVATLFIMSLIHAQTGIPVPEMTHCDTQVQNFMSTYNIPGMTYALAKDGKLKYMRAFGNANIAGSETTQPYHLFRIASVSKPITSIGIMKMVEDGLIGLNDKVFGTGGILENHWYFSNSTITDTRVYDITVQHLLEHAAGWDRNTDCFPNPTSPYPWFFGGCDPIAVPLHVTQSQGESNPVKEEFLINYLLEKTLNFTPGTSYSYSNMGFLVLSEIIEEVSGLSYEKYMQQEIFNPIGIYDMHIGENLIDDKMEREAEYVGNGFTTLDLYGSGSLVPWEYGGFALDAMDGHGGWLATSRDLVRLLVAVDGFATKPDILLPGTISTMVAPSANNAGYAKGWQVNASNNWWHSGAVDGTASLFVRSNSGYTWAIILNKRIVDANANAFWAALDGMGWDCISGTSTFPAHDLMDSPTVNASSISTSGDGATFLDISWANGNGASRIVVMKDISGISGNYNFSAYPLDGTHYIANSQFGTGDDLGDGTYVVYNGTGSNVTVTNLDVNKHYAVRVYEYTNNSNNGNNSLYLLGGAAESQVSLGIEDNEILRPIKVYPTIASEILNVEVANHLKGATFYMYDLQGRVLREGVFGNENNKIDVSALSSGMYLLLTKQGESKNISRFIKK